MDVDIHTHEDYMLIFPHTWVIFFQTTCMWLWKVYISLLYYVGDPWNDNTCWFTISIIYRHIMYNWYSLFSLKSNADKNQSQYTSVAKATKLFPMRLIFWKRALSRPLGGGVWILEHLWLVLSQTIKLAIQRRCRICSILNHTPHVE